MRSEVTRSARRRAPVLARRLAACAGAAVGRAGRSRSFTLIEVLVAVGAVALVAVALAAVFDQTGRTVTAGRRLSALTSYAALIEQQMRADFARMSRDGYLIIRNELADANRTAQFQFNPNGPNSPGVDDVVALHAEDLKPRPRRIDEIMFFAKGDFTTSRDPLHASQVARGNAARIYYGHGKRRIVNLDPTGSYLWPAPDDFMDDEPEANLGVAPPAIPANIINPNRYAADWTLLRLQTVLIPPRTTQPDWPGVGGFPPNAADLLDQDTQIAYQPAATNLFRALNVIFPLVNEPTVRAAVPPGGGPQFTSGLTDIATTSLAEVRAVVVTADRWPGQPPTGVTGQAATGTFFDPIVPGLTNNGNIDGSNHGVDGQFQVWQQPGQTLGDPDVLARMQSWMEDGLPAWSHATEPDDRTRVRYEPSAPNFLEVLRTATGSPQARLQQAWERTDQVMLSSSNFLPRCTEFTVEWTFGKAYPSDPGAIGYIAGREGELIWHGMARKADGTPVATTDQEAVVLPYLWDPNFGGPGTQRHELRYRRADGTIASAPGHRVLARVVHGQYVPSPYDPLPGETITSYFGYVDPSFNPTAANSASPTIPWAWPRLVRVTIGLADPNDPSIEQRFQFVFETPPTPEP